MVDLLDVPPGRRAVLLPVLERLRAAKHVVLTTHVNADGDGAGSEAAVAAWLEALGVHATIINPTPFPGSFAFLPHREAAVADLGTPRAEQALAAADLFLVLDTSEENRVAPLREHLAPERTIVVDHHPPGPTAVGRMRVQEPAAAATGELVFDLLSLAGGPWPPAAVQGIYVALVSDTGSFRYSNTTPRTHAIAADLLGRGVDPEAVFQRLYGTVPPRRLHLLRAALEGLRTDADLGLSWMAVSNAVVESVGATSEDFEGLIEHARSVEGTRVAILFRETPEGATKMSFRSNGDTDVNRIAREFGGGGHVKAAGALLQEPLERAVERVLERAREALKEG